MSYQWSTIVSSHWIDPIYESSCRKMWILDRSLKIDEIVTDLVFVAHLS